MYESASILQRTCINADILQIESKWSGTDRDGAHLVRLPSFYSPERRYIQGSNHDAQAMA